MKKFLPVAACLGLFLLSACADDPAPDPTQQGFDPKTITQDEADHIKDPTPICPQVAIVRDLQSMNDYGAEDPDPSQLVARGRMKSIDGDCAYLKDGIDVRFNINFMAAKGPRLGGLHVSFPYFIAVLDPEKKILNKDRMTEEFGFSSTSNIVEDQENLHVFIPLAADKRVYGPSYQVLVGFQLDEKQLSAVRETLSPLSK